MRHLTRAATRLRGRFAAAALAVLTVAATPAAVASAHADLPAPVITARPASPSTTGAAVFRFSGPAAADGFACSLDGAAFTPCASPAVYTVGDGAHSFRVKATSRAQQSPLASAGWTVDTVAPPAPVFTVKPSDPSDSSWALLAFADGEAGVGFQCALDAGAFAPCASPTLLFGLAPGGHSFSVRARDAAGNLSAAATSAWALTPPAPVIASGPAGPTNQTAATFTFGLPLASVLLPPAGLGYECSLDASAFAPCASPARLAGPLAAGAHSFRVRTVVGSLRSAPAVARWSVDTTAPPVPVITARPANPSAATDASVSFTDAEPGVRFVCRLDGAAASPCASPATFTRLAQGAHRFAVAAADAAGNVSGEAVHAWSVDTVRPPAPVLTQFPADRTTAATTTFAWTDAEAGAEFRCSLDSGAWVGCSSPYTYLADTGQRRFAVRAVDAAGNVSDTTSVKWTVRESRGVAFTIAGTAVGLTPGVWKPIAVTLTNPNDVPIHVTALTVSLSAQSTPAGCPSAANVELAQAAGLGGAPVAVPAHGSAAIPATRGPSLRLRDLATNQDACKGATFALTFTGTATN